MHSPHFTHLDTNSSSGKAPGGRMRRGLVRFLLAETESTGTAIAADAIPVISHLLSRSTLPSDLASLAGPIEIAPVGHTSLQLKHTRHSLEAHMFSGNGVASP